MKTEHKLMWVFMLMMWLTTSCGVAQPAMIDGQIIAMQTGSAIEVFKAAVTGAHGAQMFTMPVPGGVGYMAVQPFEGWFGVVLYSTSSKCTGQCLQEMLRLTGNAMTPATLQELISHAEKIGFTRALPVALPGWMKLAAGMAHEAWSSTQLATAWVVIVPLGAFGVPDGMQAEQVDN
mgnify:CR=1 FL=1